MKYIPYGHQSINKTDIKEIYKVMTSEWLTQGPAIDRFEKAISTCCEAKHAVAVSSATAALHLSCLALSLGPNDYLWTSPNSFVASANCALYCGAKVDFVDIDLQTYNMSVSALKEKLIVAEKKGRLPKIVVPVHFSGQSCDMKKIWELSKYYNFKIIEDASHALGGSYKENKVGSCKYSDITVFSFHPVKIITTGEGGIALTNNKDLYNTLLRLRSHGITRNKSIMQGEIHGPWYYQQIELGFNYRMTDIQAALGLSQLKKLNKYIKKRTELAQIYTQQLLETPLILPFVKNDCISAWHLYVVMLDLEKISKTRLFVFEAMRQANIGVNVHYIPIHTQPYYLKNGFKSKQFKNAEYYYERAITLPLYPDLAKADQQRVVTTLKAILK